MPTDKSSKTGVTKITQDQFIQLASSLVTTCIVETADQEYMIDTLCNAIAATEKAMEDMNIEVRYERK